MTDDISSTRVRIEQLARNYQRVVLAILAERYAQAKPAPPKPLTIPKIFGPEHGENFISDYLAYVLDPGKNGIGEAPLAQLLSLCGVDPADLPLAEVTIHREYSLENGRIDLLLEWEDLLVLGIENKILSAEGEEQTKRYADAFCGEFTETPYHLVYLTREGQKPGSKAFQPVSYLQLLKAFREVQVADEISARRRVLWEDFLEHLEVYIIMSDPEHFEFSDKAQLCLEHLDMILDLEDALKRDWNDALSYIRGQISAHLEDGDWKTSFDEKGQALQVYKSTWGLSTVVVRYEYRLSIEDLRSQKVLFMVNVQGGQKDELLSLFDQRHPGLQTTYLGQGIDYRPRDRRNAIAWKTYPISRDVDQIARAFIDAFNEFQFLEKEIDDVLAEWKQQNEAVA